MEEIKIDNHVINNELNNILKLMVVSYNSSGSTSLNRAIGKLETLISIIDSSNDN